MGYGVLTYLLFLKMAHEYSEPLYGRDTRAPKGFDRPSPRGKTGDPLEAHSLALLHRLGNQG